MGDFFNDNSTKKLIESYEKKLSALTPNGEFEKERNEYMLTILNSMRNGALEWDKFTHYNRRIIGDYFKNELKNESRNEMSNYMIDLMFSSLLRFLMEFCFYNKVDVGENLIHAFAFAVKNKDKFSETTQEQIEYAKNLMPFLLLKECYQGDDVQDFIKAAEAEKKLKTRMDYWEGKIEEQTERVEALSTILERQEIAYNFVGLSKAFNNLLIIKRVESRNALAYVIILAILTLLPLVSEFFYLLSAKEGTSIDQSKLVLLIPAVSITAIMIYYFRVSLSNFQSIKSQVVQIELRKSLCAFIQNYSEYAENMKDKESLRKFENVIFSNIMPSEDKIPSTFDGIEQIAKLIESVKGK
ncbi:hypothetical protein [Pectobacterium versatile]|uniref:hypothetical protein n=1 Tax=Pectobacterium versatile TaxID=2488639 RepID=UPI001F2B73A9|nr:hypothetical protein [Pectobacterium versatile]